MPVCIAQRTAVRDHILLVPWCIPNLFFPLSRTVSAHGKKVLLRQRVCQAQRRQHDAALGLELAIGVGGEPAKVVNGQRVLLCGKRASHVALQQDPLHTPLVRQPLDGVRALVRNPRTWRT